MDILADGSLDYPDDVLERFDFVVASVHSRFKLDPKSQTDRILRAVANPYTTILGHMTGRQLFGGRVTKLISKAFSRHAPRMASLWKSMQIPGASTLTGAGTSGPLISDAS